MTISISGACRACRHLFRAETDGLEQICCTYCDADPIALPAPDDIFCTCAMCGCEVFYRQKDFNPALGCCVVAFAAILVPWTYGLSLLPAAALDWWLYRRTPDVAVCYHCRSQFRGYSMPAAIRGFDHFLAEKYEETATP